MNRRESYWMGIRRFFIPFLTGISSFYIIAACTQGGFAIAWAVLLLVAQWKISQRCARETAHLALTPRKCIIPASVTLAWFLIAGAAADVAGAWIPVCILALVPFYLWWIAGARTTVLRWIRIARPSA